MIQPEMNFIEELTWRGLIQDITPGLDAYLQSNKITGYLGADPTGTSLHIGNLVPVMMLMHLQRAGHHPVALVGGATGLIGDPSGKDKERSLMTEEQVAYNVSCIQAQMAHFLDFEGVPNPARMVNNYDWFKDMGFIPFLRDVGKYLTVSYMLSKDSVKKRMESEQGISYTEFAYQLLQGYDYLYMYEHMGVRLQIGGSDQWGNILTGTELIRRKLGGDAFGVTCPLLTRADGSKFGKTAGGESVWLDAKRTSPYTFYQYWMNASDEDAYKLIKIFTLKGREEIEALQAAHLADPGQRSLHKALADDITRRVHGEAGLQSALNLTAFHFSKQAPLHQLAQADWEEVASGPDRKTLPRENLAAGTGILDVLVQLGVAQSRGDAKRAIEADKSVMVNGVRIESADTSIGLDVLFYDRFFQVQRGKKQKYIVEVIHERS